MAETSKILLNIRELSGLTGLAVPTIYEYVSMRKIPHVKIGKRVLFDRGEIDKWIEALKVPAAEPFK
jgi:excisionase family DNA binding protein